MSVICQAEEQAALLPASGRRIPAWLLSLALHLAAFLVGTLLIRTTSTPPYDEPQRRTSIVLARSTPQASPQYFDQEDVAAQLTPADDSSLQAAARSAFEDALSAEPPASGIALPESTGGAVPAGLLAIEPSSSEGRGKSGLRGLTATDVAAILAEDAARPREAAARGPTARLSLFGSAEAEGRSFVFLIDRSQSMGHEGLGAIAAAAQELAASIDRLGPEHRFAVIAYNQKPNSLSGRQLIPATADNKRKLIEFVATTVAFGATEHELGLFAALALKPEVIFLLTDGGEPELKPGQLRAIQAAAGRTTIHTLHFGAGPPDREGDFLQKLAAQNGGSYHYIDLLERDCAAHYPASRLIRVSSPVSAAVGT